MVCLRRTWCDTHRGGLLFWSMMIGLLSNDPKGRIILSINFTDAYEVSVHFIQIFILFSMEISIKLFKDDIDIIVHR